MLHCQRQIPSALIDLESVSRHPSPRSCCRTFSLALDRHTTPRARAAPRALPRMATALPVTARRVFKTQKAAQRSILVQIVEGESLSPDDCSQLGKCSVRNLPPDLPMQTPIDVRFRYEENGRLTVSVRVEGTDKNLEHEITRENSLTQEQLDSWRQYICGQAADAPASE